MCLILLSFKQHPRYPLVIAANRDEFYDRPTAPAAFWDEAPDLLAGKDLRGGGTWFGVTRSGRIAALTNYRDPRAFRKDAPSRGLLVKDFLQGESTGSEFIEMLRRKADRYNGFSMIFGDVRRLHYFSNREIISPFLSPGIHGQSNHLLDTPWPKVIRGKTALQRLMSGKADIASKDLFTILADRTTPADALLPDTGIGLEKERFLSAPFILGSSYGTRSSTVLIIDCNNNVIFAEQTFNGDPDHASVVEYRFRIGE